MVNYKTLVIGASPNSDRYSHQVVVRLFEAGIEVVPMGIKEGKIGNIKIVSPFTPQKGIHTISLYLSIEKQDKYTDFIIKLKPQRLIFNPGAENKILAEKLNTEGIFWENSCNLVLLATNQYQT
jgi:predicted CoA-binding protein